MKCDIYDILSCLYPESYGPFSECEATPVLESGIDGYV
jgi:hypothetical protein